MARVLVLSYGHTENIPWKQSDRLKEYLEARSSVKVDVIDWKDPSIKWSDYSVVTPLEAWSYPEYLVEFRNLLYTLFIQNTNVVNHPAVLVWSSDKRYLPTLQKRGVSVIPSVVVHNDGTYDPEPIKQWSSLRKELVIKPTVGSGAAGVVRLGTAAFLADPAEGLSRANAAKPTKDGGFIIQPFLSEVKSDGEYSVIFIDNKFSHAVRKVPKTDDFRVHESYGGNSVPYSPSQEEIEQVSAIIPVCIEAVLARDHGDPTVVASPLLADAAGNTADTLRNSLLYARIDYVKLADPADGKVKPHVMEVEVLEPNLFYHTTPDTPGDMPYENTRDKAESPGSTSIIQKPQKVPLAKNT